jgi:hypothetical protein
MNEMQFLHLSADLQKNNRFVLQYVFARFP